MDKFEDQIPSTYGSQLSPTDWKKYYPLRWLIYCVVLDEIDITSTTISYIISDTN